MFITLICCYIGAALLRNIVIVFLLLKSGTAMHNKMAEKVLRSKSRFFDLTSSGEILTRFTKDIVMIDFLMPPQLMLITFGLFRSLSVAISVAVVTPYTLIPIAVCLAIMILVLRLSLQALNES